MKIALLGNHRPAHSTESDLVWTFRDMGHEVIPLQEDEVISEQVFDVAKSCNLLFWMHTHGWLNRGDMFLCLARLRGLGVKTVSFSLDLFAEIGRAANYVGVHPWFKTDIFFGVDGGSEVFYRQHNVNHHWIRPGVIRRDCYCEGPDDMLAGDVCFIGSYHYHREWPYRPRLIDWLRQTYGDRFKKYGNPEATVRGKLLNSVYASAKVVVGDSLCPGYTHPHYWSDRAYETIGRGGFLIHPWIQGMMQEFTDGVHLRFYEYGDFVELKRLIDYYVEHDAERESIRRRGHLLVKEFCTYHNRMKELLAILTNPAAAKYAGSLADLKWPEIAKPERLGDNEIDEIGVMVARLYNAPVDLVIQEARRRYRK